MSKKSRRARAKFRVSQQATGRREIGHPEAAKAEVGTKVMTAAGTPVVLAQTARYQHIIPELRRIGIISAVLFLIIIILSFVIK